MVLGKLKYDISLFTRTIISTIRRNQQFVFFFLTKIFRIKIKKKKKQILILNMFNTLQPREGVGVIDPGFRRYFFLFVWYVEQYKRCFYSKTEIDRVVLDVRISSNMCFFFVLFFWGLVGRLNGHNSYERIPSWNTPWKIRRSRIIIKISVYTITR